MSTFLDVLAAAAKLLSDQKTGNILSKNVLANIEIATNELKAVRSNFENPEAVLLFKSAEFQLSIGTSLYSKDPATVMASKAYFESYRGNLVPFLLKIEKNYFMGALTGGFIYMERDLQLIVNNFNRLFSSAQYTVEEMKLHHSYVLGYIRLVSMCTKFISSTIVAVTSASRVQFYHANNTRDFAEPVAKFINWIAMRSSHENILTDIERLNKENKNYNLFDGRAGINDISQDSEYDRNLLFVADHGLLDSADKYSKRGFIPNPITMVASAWISYQHARYERAAAMREWMAAKMAMLEIQKSKLDPNSDEYKRKQKILEFYNDKMSDYDSKIQEYERDA